jgi:hypothetical protein
METISVVRTVLSSVIVATVAYNLIKSVLHWDNVSPVIIAMCIGLLSVVGLGEDFSNFLSEYIWAIIIVAGLLTIIITVTSGRKPNPEGFIDQGEDGNR